MNRSPSARDLASRGSRIWFDAVTLGLLLLVCAFGSKARAQERATVRGTVVDSTGTPIWGATIEYCSEAGIQLASTDVKGAFAVQEAPAGGTLVASFRGSQR